ncbi:hypothetical protein [Pseudomonas sp. SID14000]|uniref:hypothetical protein n=1 Tax=Pseudomonas sp. SID14000 TaxID=1986221 RepID=UPI000B3C9EDE|nr:hypothetical protein [Pseudomonas sp. SID14000]
MLIVTKNPPVVGHGQVLRGPTVQSLGRAAALSGTYDKGIYLRPNLNSDGTVPARSPLSASPDIWIAGTEPVANFQTALATANSYATQSPGTITQGTPNYIYVRGRNGAAVSSTTKVQLYGVPCASIQWPSEWAKYGIPTDRDHPDGTQPYYDSSIVSLASSSIGVASDTFVWSNPQPPGGGSDHYCFITWMNNAGNPFPDVFTQLDMSALITNNLQFGWRNVSMQSGRSPTRQMSSQLIIPSDVTAGSREYSLQITNLGFPATGWTLTMSCSQPDSTGKPIAINNVAMPPAGQFVGVRCTLDPGYSALLTINLYRNNGPDSQPGAALDITPTYYADGTPRELQEALDRGLVDFAMSHALHRAYAATEVADIRPRPVVLLGADGLHVI